MVRDEDTPKTDALWKDQFPHAHAYMQEMAFYIPERNPSFPRRWDVQSWDMPLGQKFDRTLSPDNLELDISEPKCTLRTESPFRIKPTCPVFYWEVELNTMGDRDQMETIVGIGFCDNILRLLMFPYPNRSEPALEGELHPREVEVLGCGFYYPYKVFFTQNGQLIDPKAHWQSYQDVSSGPQVCLRLSQGSRAATIVKTNFGQKPFSFDIVTHCSRSLSGRWVRQRLATSPIEIVERIQDFMLLAAEDDICSHNPAQVHSARQVLAKISVVCHWWRTICSRYSFRHLMLEGKADLRYASTQLALWGSQVLDTREQSTTPWIHCLFTSALPNRLRCTDKWEYHSSESIVFNERLPANMSHAIPAMLRRGCFASMTKLNLTSLRFATWLHLARFLLSIQQLNELTLRDVAWNQDDLPLNPPRWLRFSRRIRNIRVYDLISMGKHSAHGLLCLLFAGHKNTSPTPAAHLELTLLPVDVGAAASITQALCQITDIKPNTLFCEQTSPTCCTVACSRGTDNPDLALRFARHTSEGAYHLVHIAATVDGIYPDTEGGFKLLANSRQALSNHAVCNYFFDLRGHPNARTSPMDQLTLRWYIYSAFRNELRENKVLYRPVSSQLGSFGEGPCPVRFKEQERWTVGDTVTIIWEVPFELRNSPPEVTLMVHYSGRQVQYSGRHIACMDMGVVDMVVPEQNLENADWLSLELIFNGEVWRDKPLRAVPSWNWIQGWNYEWTWES